MKDYNKNISKQFEDVKAIVGVWEHDNIFKTWSVRPGAIKGCMVDFVIWLEEPSDMERASLHLALRPGGLVVDGYNNKTTDWRSGIKKQID